MADYSQGLNDMWEQLITKVMNRNHMRMIKYVREFPLADYIKEYVIHDSLAIDRNIKNSARSHTATRVKYEQMSKKENIH